MAYILKSDLFCLKLGNRWDLVSLNTDLLLVFENSRSRMQYGLKFKNQLDSLEIWY